MKMRNLLGLTFLSLSLMCSGCAGLHNSANFSLEATPPNLAPDAPLVLAIPGLNIPAIGLPQDQQFGHLVTMLSEEGIPCKVLAYDTPEHPLTHVASLDFHDTNIGTTRVGPALVDAIQNEHSRRAREGLVPLQDVVLFSYSQGAVIANRVAEGIFIFKKKYQDFSNRFGAEWTALQRDPEFLYLMNALSDYLVIQNIKVQREGDFLRDPDLRSFYRRARKKLDSQASEFLKYLKDPQARYPQVQQFEPPESPKYPKLYPKFAACAEKCFANLHEYGHLKQFFVDYATYKDVLKIHFWFISTAGSYFGSPEADKTYGLMEALPFLKIFVGRELRQIKDTRLGSPHQTKDAQDLLAMKRNNHYPFCEKDTLFLVGANGDRGDGLVEQSSAHLADHALGTVRIDATQHPKEKIAVLVDRLPDITIVPLQFTHFPKNNIFGHSYGAAYMEKGNPVFPYLLAFIHKDWNTINKLLSRSDIKLQQFMVQIFPSRSFTRKAASNNIKIVSECTNTDSGTQLWNGHFVGDDQTMTLLGDEKVSGFITVQQGKTQMDIPVYPGCNTLIKVEEK